MPKQIQEIKDFLLTARRKGCQVCQDQKEQGQHQVQGAMQPLSLHFGRPRSRKGGEAEAVSSSRPRRQGVEVKREWRKNEYPKNETKLSETSREKYLFIFPLFR